MQFDTLFKLAFCLSRPIEITIKDMYQADQVTLVIGIQTKIL